MAQVVDMIEEKYAPLVDALRQQGISRVTLHPVVISRTGAPHSRTEQEVSQLLTMASAEDGDTPQVTKAVKSVLRDLHVHAVKWLARILVTARKHLRPTGALLGPAGNPPDPH